ASSSDPESGVAGYAFPSLGSGWTDSQTGATDTYSFSASAADPVEPNNVTATNNAGLTSNPSSFTVTPDNTAPTTSLQCNGAPCTGGWATSLPVSITLSATDSGSGVANIKYTTDGSDPFTSPTASVYSGAFNVNASTTIEFAATDNVGNTEAPQSTTIQIDLTPPSAPSLSLSAGANAFVSGSTVFFRPGASGSFDVTAGSSDPESGIAGYAFPSLGSGWSDSQSGATDTYNFTASAVDPAEPNNVTATNNAGLTSNPSSFTVTADGSAPTTSIACSGGCSGWHTTSPVTVSLTADDGAGSGVAQIKYTTDGSDPSPLNGTLYTAPFSVPATATVKFRAYDNVGNAEPVRSQLVQVDTSAPSTPSLSLVAGANSSVTGSTVFFRPGASGSFSLTASSTDTESGIASYTFPNLGTGWSRTISGATATYSFTASAVDPAEPNNVVATNGAGLDSNPTSFTVTADSSAPTTSIACSGGCSGWHTSAVSVTLSADDGSGSGLAQIRYTTDGSDPNVSGTTYTGPFSVGATATVKAAATDNVGNVEAPGSTTVQVDTSAPTAPSLGLSAGANASVSGSTVFFRPGASGSFDLTASSSDPESGVAGYAFPSLGSGWTDSQAGATDTYNFTASAADPVGPNNVTATNNAGLTSNPSSFTVTADSSAPTTSIGCSGGCGGWHANAVTVTLTADDGTGSGVAQIKYTTDGSDPTVSGTLYSAPFTVSSTSTVRFAATDNVGNVEAAQSQTVQVDLTAPSVAVTAPVDGGFLNASTPDPYTITATASDSESGLATVEFFECSNQSAGCATGNWSSLGVTSGGPPWSVAWTLPSNGNRALMAVATDGVGRQASSVINTFVDRTDPTVSLSPLGAYLSGTVSLDASANDGESGVKQVQFQRCDSPCGGSWTDVGAADTTAPYSASFDTTSVPDGTYDFRAVVTDNAGNTASDEVTARTIDNTAPDTTITNGPSVTVNSSSASFDFTASESATFECSLDGGAYSGCSSPAAYSGLADGTHTFRVRATDLAGNTDPTPATSTWTIDTVAPNTTISSGPSDPTASTSASLAFTSSESGSTFECSLDGGAYSGCSSPAAYSGLADGSHTFSVRATDPAGNTDPTPASLTWTVDSTAPTGALTAPANGATVGGSSVDLAASASDPGGTGVASVEFQYRPVGGSSWTSISTDSSAPYQGSWNAAALSSGDYELTAVVTDAAGNQFTTPVVTVTVDSTPPSVTLSDPGSPIHGIVLLTATSPDTDLNHVTFEWRPAGGSWTAIGTVTGPWTIALDTTAVSDGPYDLRAVAYDAFGNSNSDTRTNVQVDNTAPRVASSVPGEGAVVATVSSIDVTATEDLAGFDSPTLDGAPIPAPTISGPTASFATGALATGPHTLGGRLRDAVGNTRFVLVHFTVWSGVAVDYPYVEANSPFASGVTLIAVDGSSHVQVPADALADPGTGDWPVLRVDPDPAPAGLQNGYGVVGQVVGVSMSWAIGGGPIQDLNDPLDVVVTNVAGTVPAVLQSGSWRTIQQVPTAGTLPSGWNDGYYVDAAGVHILSLHPSRFALLRDQEVPTPPQSFAGVVGPGGLTLSWQPGSDNSGAIDHFSLYVDGTQTATYGGAVRSANLGAFSADDPRVFTLSESDAAGNESAQTQRLRTIPTVAGLKVDQAKSVLAGRAFAIGKISYSPNKAPAGTVLSPTGLRLAVEGAPVDLVVSTGPAPTPLVLSVSHPPTFSWAKSGSLRVSVLLSRAAKVTATLIGPNGRALFTWSFAAATGKTKKTLRMPSGARKSGRYTIRWVATAADTGTARKTTRLRILGRARRGRRQPIFAIRRRVDKD
ncbi:MAG: chitobiase/beta-hexosaminidase C-terminal domain-containing protein, partial [Gaiellaceae bacterium]